MLEALALVQQNNPQYEKILDNIHKELGPSVWSDFANEHNGHLITDNDSNEMKELVARAYNIYWINTFGDLNHNGLTLAKDIVFQDNSPSGIDLKAIAKEGGLKDPGTLFQGKYEVKFSKHRKDKYGESHTSATINAQSITNSLEEIKDNYHKIKQIYQHIGSIKAAIKSKNSEELASITKKIVDCSLMTNEEVIDKIKFICETEQANKKLGFISSFRKAARGIYHKIYSIDPKKELDSFFAQTKSSLTQSNDAVYSMERGEAVQNAGTQMETAQKEVLHLMEEGKLSKKPTTLTQVGKEETTVKKARSTSIDEDRYL